MQEEMETAMKLRTAGGTVKIGDSKEGDAAAVRRAIEKLRADAAAATAANTSDEGKLRKDTVSLKSVSSLPEQQMKSSELVGKARAALQRKEEQNGGRRNDHAMFGTLRKPTVADGLSPELQRALEKLRAQVPAEGS
jgi:hypothetical protein